MILPVKEDAAPGGKQ